MIGGTRTDGKVAVELLVVYNNGDYQNFSLPKTLAAWSEGILEITLEDKNISIPSTSIKRIETIYK